MGAWTKQRTTDREGTNSRYIGGFESAHLDDELNMRTEEEEMSQGWLQAANLLT